MDVSSFLLFHICKFSLQQGETWFPPSAIHSHKCSIPVFIDSGIRIFNPCPWRNSIIYQNVVLMCSFFYLLVLLTILISKVIVVNIFLIHSSSVRLLHTFAILLDSILGSPISQTIFKNLCTLKFPLCARKLYGCRKMQNHVSTVMYHTDISIT